MIPESTFQRIKDEADIVKIVSEYIKLEKKSSSYTGLCPFHPDQNPSLNVSPTKQIYKCFSCGAAGDVIEFVRNYEKVSFPRAVQIIGAKIGIDIKFENDENYETLSKYYNILLSSSNFYNFILENTVAGSEAKKYLYKRNLNDEIIKRFKIGLAQDEPDLLYKSLLDENYQPLDMIEAGVVRGSKSYYDVFRDRIMFPLDDINGRIVGFSGRVYKDTEKSVPKYINSTENKVFKKGNILYNFSEAENHIRQQDFVYVFEGFMDVIAAYRCGIHNTVATMGTSISLNQIQSIKKSTNNIVLCYDGDNPGVEASKKAIMQFLKADLNVMAILLPDKTDPDDYINKHGADKLSDLLTNSQISGYDFLYEVAKRELNLDNLNSVESFKNEIFNYLNYFNSNVLTERFFVKLAKDISVSQESLKLDYDKVSRNFVEPIEYYDVPDFPTLPEAITTVRHKVKKFDKAFEELINIAYSSQEYCNLIKNRLNDRYVTLIHNSLLLQIDSHYKTYGVMNKEHFSKSLGSQEQDLLVNILNNQINDFTEIKAEEIQEHIDSYISVVHDYYKFKEVESLRESIKKEGSPSKEKLQKLAETKRPSVKFINK